MLRLTLKNLVENRVRFAMTTFAVVLAVSFVVSSFILTDGLRATFGQLSEEIVAGTDLEVRPSREFGGGARLNHSALPVVAGTNGVKDAVPLVEAGENSIRPLNAAGEPVPLNGPPQLAFSWSDNTRVSPFALVRGEAPQADEFAMDVDAADRHGFVLGKTYDVVTPTGLSTLTLTGLTTFGQNNDTLGAVLMQFPLDTLQGLIGVGGYDSIQVELEDGADSSIVQRSITTALSGVDVVDSATLESEQKAEFNENIDIIGNVLLGFAGVSLFVSTFIIYNTFSIVLSQRTRELALLRTIGADPVQLRRAVQTEAAVIGLLASAIGIGAGVGVAFGLRAVFGAIGATLPDSPTIISARTIIVAVFVGVVVTFASAVGPARKASRVPAMAALRDGAETDTTYGRRIVVGSTLGVIGAVAGAIGLFVGTTTTTTVLLLAIGAIGVFTAIALLSPLLVGRVTGLLAWPMRRLAGVSGKLAQENAARNPRRTATTAAALMIGLALVTMALTVGESLKAQLRATLDESVHADYIITEDADVSFPANIRDQVRSLEATTDVVAWRYDSVVVGGRGQEVVSGDHASVEALFDLGIVDGVATSANVSNPILVSDDEAAALDLSVGDVVPALFGNGAARDMVVTGIFSDDVIIEEDYLFDSSTWAEVGANRRVDWLALSVDPNMTEAEVAASFADLSRVFPNANIDTFGEFVDGLEALVDQALAALNVMVALAVIIALIGIANTLALSVFERTRELGLLRAVGMTRRQLRRMIRFEAGLVALFGAVLGVATGIGFGWAAVAALPSSLTSTMAIPVERIVVLVIVAGVAGLGAAWAPARRAGRLNVLDAINN